MTPGGGDLHSATAIANPRAGTPSAYTKHDDEPCWRRRERPYRCRHVGPRPFISPFIN